MDSREHEIQPRSLNMKVLTVLGSANKLAAPQVTRDDLVEAIIAARLPAFMYFKHHRRHGSQLVCCSAALIRDRVELCGDLRLLDQGTWRLTRMGQNAVLAGKFESVVVGQTVRFLSEKGYDLSQIHGQVQVTNGSLWLPTSKALYDRGGGTLKLPIFRGLLGLLAECGFFRVVQSRIYLPSQ